MYRIFRVPAGQTGQIDALFKDELVSRQSLVVRESRSLGVEGEGTLVLVEGSDAGLARAEALLKDAGKVLAGAEAEAAYRRFKAQDEDAASGMGLIFGA
ncbi:MAG: hypothetical protein AABX97_04105 [Candidatus Thermoplasmatota archaeon]